MLFKFELEGGNFSKAGYASSQIKKVLKQLAIDPRIIKSWAAPWQKWSSCFPAARAAAPT